VGLLKFFGSSEEPGLGTCVSFFVLRLFYVASSRRWRLRRVS
jgi:hypothetical protein